MHGSDVDSSERVSYVAARPWTTTTGLRSPRRCVFSLTHGQ